MKKSALFAVIMAFALFVYGYLMSSAGHDHAAHDSHTHEHSR